MVVLNAALLLLDRASEALARFEEAFLAFERQGDHFTHYAGIGHTYLAVGRLEDADRHAQAALEASRRRKIPHTEIFALILCARVASRRSPPKTAEALVYFAEALELSRRRGPQYIARTLLYRGTLFRQLADYDQAEADLTEALAVFRQTEALGWAEVVARELSLVTAGRGQPPG